jgi:hypothetical protein
MATFFVSWTSSWLCIRTKIWVAFRSNSVCCRIYMTNLYSHFPSPRTSLTNYIITFYIRKISCCCLAEGLSEL